jgi:transposase
MAKCSKAEIRRLKTALRWKIPAAQRQRIQMVLLRESGMTQPEIAAAMGVSLSTVNRAHMAYDHGGIRASSAGYNLRDRSGKFVPRPQKRCRVSTKLRIVTLAKP